MLYTEFLQLWHEAVQAVDSRAWPAALAKLQQISEPTSRTLFNAASAHLVLGQLDRALEALDLTISKDQRLAVGFFQRAAVMMQVGRLEDALSDCIWAQKHMRGNTVIDYRQLGLRFKLHSWQVLYNAAAVYCRMGQWEQAREVLLSASQERGGGRGGTIEVALDSVLEEEVLAPLLVPEDIVFRPRKQDVDQLQQRDFLGKAKVISSVIPNDDFGGFEPLRLQKPGFYEPKVEGAQDPGMRMRIPYMARGPGQLTIPGGAMVFLFGEEDRDGLATVIHDGQKGLVPMSLLDPADVKMPKGRKEKRVPSGIPLPPGLKPPSRPQAQPSSAAPPRDTPPPSYIDTTVAPLLASQPRRNHANDGNHGNHGNHANDPNDANDANDGNHGNHANDPNDANDANDPNHANDSNEQHDGVAPGPEAGSVVLKVHYTFSVALSVPVDLPFQEVKERVAQQLGQPAARLRLRHKQHGSRVLIPLGEEAEPGRAVQEVAEAGRATLWCQVKGYRVRKSEGHGSFSSLPPQRPLEVQANTWLRRLAQQPEKVKALSAPSLRVDTVLLRPDNCCLV
ncbi:NADPH oxidase activator 1 [Pseudoliparis swirei]|uniref:NADPH oxidase activator 1 n=1 Tax=Pseudoliparis swirei TaxID=2059687 RepID=UPI0024BDC03E|nr:NADPH oxidase activator 1 [Pseudoliparis swirei]